MKFDSNFYTFLKNHKRIEPFNYDVIIDWAVQMLMNGHNYKSIISIAAMSKPVSKEEISNDITDALKDLNLIEAPPLDIYLMQAQYHIKEILDNNEIRIHLESLYKIYIESNDPKFTVFFSLYHAWKDLESNFIINEMNGVQLYYMNATLENIESYVIVESKNWLDTYINNNTQL